MTDVYRDLYKVECQRSLELAGQAGTMKALIIMLLDDNSGLAKEYAKIKMKEIGVEL